jgi:threonine/homoserine/homoserine lactone efflux protein
MAFPTDFAVFLLSVVVISLSGVLLPGPLFAVTIEKAAKRQNAGALIALGHGIIEFPLMFLIFFLLTEFQVPMYVEIGVSLVGGLLMVFIGVQTFLNRNKTGADHESSSQESLLAGIKTTAANPGFILWWLTVGTTLILHAKMFLFPGFLAFAGVHWSVDFVWYTAVAFVIFKSHRFWTPRVYQAITVFCISVLVGVGAWFFGSALWQLITTL